MVSGWAHTEEALSPLPDLLKADYQVDAISLRKLDIAQADAPRIGIGWSAGAIALIETEIRQPGTFTKLVLISATSCFCRTSGYRCGFPERSLEAMIADLSSEPETVLSAFFMNAAFPLSISADALSAKVDSAMQIGVARLLDGLRYLKSTDLREGLARVNIPTLLLHGESDRIIPCDASRFLEKHLPRSRRVTYEDIGHDLLAQTGPRAIAAISAFLR